MPVRVRKIQGRIKGGKKFAVVDSKGKKHGTHKIKSKAIAQAQVINLSLLRAKRK